MKDIWKALKIAIEDNLPYFMIVLCILLLIVATIIYGTKGFVITFLIGGLIIICYAIIYVIVCGIKDLFNQFKENLYEIKHDVKTEIVVTHPEFRERKLSGKRNEIERNYKNVKTKCK